MGKFSRQARAKLKMPAHNLYLRMIHMDKHGILWTERIPVLGNLNVPSYLQHAPPQHSRMCVREGCDLFALAYTEACRKHICRGLHCGRQRLRKRPTCATCTQIYHLNCNHAKNQVGAEYPVSPTLYVSSMLGLHVYSSLHSGTVDTFVGQLPSSALPCLDEDNTHHSWTFESGYAFNNKLTTKTPIDLYAQNVSQVDYNENVLVSDIVPGLNTF